MNFDKIHQEIDNLIKNKETTLSNSIKKSLEIIEESLNKYGPESLSISYNGGKDSVVLLNLLAVVFNKHYITKNGSLEMMPKIQALYIKHSEPFPEVDEFIEKSINRYNLDLVIIEESMKKALEKYSELKPKVKGILIGVRRNDPYGDKLSNFIPTDPDWPLFMRIHPLLDWNYVEIWEFLRTLNIPYCKLYDSGYTSLGGINNTFPNPVLKNPLKSCGFDPAWMLTDESKERFGREK